MSKDFKLTMWKGTDARDGHEGEQQFVLRVEGQGADRLSPLHPDLAQEAASFEALRDWMLTGALCGNTLVFLPTEMFAEQLNGEILWEATHACNG